MGRARQTFERRQLGLTLRRLREQADQSQQAAAERIGKARSRIVQIEDGEGTPTPENLATLLDLYQAGDDERETVLALGTEARKRQKRRAYVDTLPHAYQRFADLEASATEIRAFEAGIVPGLLQSPDYVRTVIEEWADILPRSSPNEVEERIAYRLHRQARTLDSTGPASVRVVLAEEALRKVVGDRELMRKQLRHIRSLLDDREGLVVRVLPNETTTDPARSGGFTIFDFGDRGAPVGFSSVVYGPSLYLDDKADTDTLSRLFERVHEFSLDPGDSTMLISKILEEV